MGRSHQVREDGLFPTLPPLLESGRGDRMKFIDPGIVDQNIDFAHCFHCLLRQVGDGCCIRQIGRQKQVRIIRKVLQGFLCGLPVFVIMNDDAGAMICKLPGDLPTDTAGCPGHQH